MTVDEYFWKIHSALPRQAPGSDETSLRLFKLAGDPTGKALDIGCGPGRASLLLTESGLEVVALDTHQPFLDELRAMADCRKMSEKISTRNLSMDAIDYADENFDLIWAEGSAYIMGWEKALKGWRRFLKPGGKLVATECCWLTDKPSDGAREFWAENYPTMLTLDEATRVAREQGYGVVGTYILPASDWFDEYYTPLKQRHVELSKNADDAMKQAIELSSREIELYEKHGEEYGYVGFVLEKTHASVD